MGQASSAETRQKEMLKEEHAKVQKSLTRLNGMLQECDANSDTAAGLEDLRSATREQLDELEQQLDDIRQT
ncbi:MAG: hypothetical protein R6U10_02280 [Thermoplasmatota archaeon]